MNPHDILPLNPRDFLILFVLEEGDLHGYGIVKAVEKQSDGEVRLDPANLYRSIKRLIRDGLIAESESSSESLGSKSRRRDYSITEGGRKILEAEASRLAKLTDMARARNMISEPGRLS